MRGGGESGCHAKQLAQRWPTVAPRVPDTDASSPHTHVRNPETDAGIQIKQKQIHADAKEIKDRYKIVAFPNTDRTKYILFVSDFLVSSKT